MSQPQTPQQRREHPDPDEMSRPLPWFFTMFLGAMAMWGAFYIYATPSGAHSALGDQRTLNDLRPAEASTAGVDGKQIYAAKCAACHQASGTGVPGVFPPLAASEWVLGDAKILTRLLLHGVTGPMEVRGTLYNGTMPGWKSLGDEELVAVMNYIRTDWGNGAGAVALPAVSEQRAATAGRNGPYQGGQELRSTD